MKEYQAYLFDIDGTLLDTMELIFQTFRRTCRQYADKEVSRQTVWSHVGVPLRTQLSYYLGDMGEREEDILRFHMDYQTSIYKDYLRIFPGVQETLERLSRRGTPMGVVTSRLRPSLLRYLKHFGIQDYFSVVATPECTAAHKPDPAPVLWALDRLSCGPDEVLFVGDAGVDILSGRRAGVDTAFALWGPNAVDQLSEEPTWVLENLNDLLRGWRAGHQPE